MRCRKCGSYLALDDESCKRCGAPRPRLAPQFDLVERQYALLRARLASGEMNQADFETALKALTFEDEKGDFWLVGADSGEWYRHDGQAWIRQDPPLAGEADVLSPAAVALTSGKPPTSSSPAAPKTQPSGASGISVPWLFVGAGCGLIVIVVLVAVAAVVVFPIRSETDSAIAEPGVVTLEAALPAATTTQTPSPAPAPTDTSTATPEPTVSATASPTLQPTFTPTPPPSPTGTSTPANTSTPPPTYTPVPTWTPAPISAATSKPPTSTPLPAVKVNKIAFVSDRDGNREIYVMNVDGSGVVRLTNNPAEDHYPAWSPDGKRIAFVSTRDGNPEIYTVNLDGSGLTRLTNDPASDYNPAWSPDGTSIAFDADRDVAIRADLWVMNADGSNPVKLSDFGQQPTWSPDGSWLGGLFRFTTGVNLGVIPSDGSAAATQLIEGGMNTGPDWSPDGSGIVFQGAESSADSDILVLDAGDSSLTNLTHNPAAADVSPSWSDDGRRIAFASDRDGNSEIYVMNADGSGVQRLTNNSAWDSYPAWSP